MFQNQLAFRAVLVGVGLAASASSQGPITPQPAPIYTIDATAKSMDSIADLNGDGIRDLILGNPDGQPFPTVELRSGRNGSLLASVTGPSGSSFGYTVRSTGDVLGDGLEDVLVGAPDENAGSGVAYLFAYTPGGGMSLVQSWTRDPSNPTTNPEAYGTSVTRIDDIVNNDGIEEIAVGAPFFDSATTGTGYDGLVEVLDVSTSPPTLIRALKGLSWDQLGDSLCALEDLDNDNLRELVIGATQAFGPNGTVPGTDPGYVDVYSGQSLGFMNAVRFAHTTGFWPFSLFGFDVASAGDVDNFGLDDLVVGAPDPLQNGTQIAPTYRGHEILAAGGGSVPVWRIQQNPDFPDTCRDYGASVTGLTAPGGNGDFDNDGWADTLIGAPERFSVCGTPGKAFLMSGRTGQKLWDLQAPGKTLSFGWAVTELFSVSTAAGSIEHFAVADPFGGKVYVY